MQGNAGNLVWDPLQKSEMKRPGSSMPVCAAGPWIQMQVLFPSISTVNSSMLLLTLTVLLLLLLPSRHFSL